MVDVVQILLVFILASGLRDQLVIDPQDVIGAEPRPDLPQVDMSLVPTVLRHAAQELRAHAEQHVVGVGAGSFLPGQVAHWPASLPHNVEDDILGSIIR